MKVPNLVRLSAGAAFVLVGVLTLASPPPQPAGLGYHLVKTIPMPKTPRETFDYLTMDSAGRRVYVSHGSEVEVVDLDSGMVVGTVGGLKGCHGIALDKELGKGYITDGSAASIVVFDLATLKVTGMVKGEPDADAALFDPASKLIFTFNGDSKSATVIDPTKDTVVKRIDLKGGPEFPASDGMGMVYDNNNETNEVMAIDTRTLEIKARWSAKPAGGLTAMAIDGPHRRIFSAGRNPQMLIMMDADNGKVIQSFPITSGVDAVVFEPSTNLVFASTREGKVHIFHEDSPDKLSVADTVDTSYGGKTMAVDAKTHNIYVSTADFGDAPAPTPQQPNPNRRAIVGTMHLLVYGR